MYLGACTLKAFVDRGQPRDEEPLYEVVIHGGTLEGSEAVSAVETASSASSSDEYDWLEDIIDNCNLEEEQVFFLFTCGVQHQGQ